MWATATATLSEASSSSAEKTSFCWARLYVAKNIERKNPRKKDFLATNKKKNRKDKRVCILLKIVLPFLALLFLRFFFFFLFFFLFFFFVFSSSSFSSFFFFVFLLFFSLFPGLQDQGASGDGLRAVSVDDILEMQRREQEKESEKVRLKNRIQLDRGLQPESLFFEDVFS
jgi:hypothetical protein